MTCRFSMPLASPPSEAHLSPNLAPRHTTHPPVGWPSGRLSESGIQRGKPRFWRTEAVKIMESSRIKLHPRTVEAIAYRVIDLLQRNAAAAPELIDAAELARRLGVDRSWVYTHAIKLGGIRLGKGPRPRLRFDPKLAAVRMRALGQDTDRPGPRDGRRRADPSDRDDAPRLLPIKGGGAS